MIPQRGDGTALDLHPTSTYDTSDCNNDGDSGTDADIEAFSRVLAGGNC